MQSDSIRIHPNSASDQTLKGNSFGTFFFYKDTSSLTLLITSSSHKLIQIWKEKKNFINLRVNITFTDSVKSFYTAKQSAEVKYVNFVE